MSQTASQFASLGTVLLAIPGEALRQQMATFVAALGYTCLPISTVDAAIQVVQDGVLNFDLVLSDVPVAEAGKIASTISAASPATRMLFLSSEPEDVAVAVLPHPAVTFIEKPFSWAHLRRVLFRMFTTRR